ncbi:MAG TPA: hypothetical protein VF297_30095 [Pyrinomonadaceae bacterium]
MEVGLVDFGARGRVESCVGGRFGFGVGFVEHAAVTFVKYGCS